MSLQQLYKWSASKPIYDDAFLVLLFLFECVLGLAILRFVPYTEIDWKAYMQEVETWLVDGETDYQNIRGDTGPLVYPAGFLYLFALLRHYTKQGTDILLAQYMFYGFYLLNQLFVWLIYRETLSSIRKSAKHLGELTLSHQVWGWRVAMGLTCLSKRLHSIFLLRLFNDGPTMLLLYVSVYLFMKQNWNSGCFVFSLAVSIKMNVLLFAPGLFLLLLQTSPDLWTVFWRLALGCALPQLVLGAPFLMTYPISYLRKAFELDRVFFYKWTVNWKFLEEEVFLSKPLAVALLCLHVGGLVYLAVRWLAAAKRQTTRRIFLQTRLSPHYIAYTMFVSNFIGIAFARTLHYQFYAWYVASIPYMLFSSYSGKNASSWVLRILPVVGLEFAFLTFPATQLSSAVLQVSHLIVLWGIKPPTEVCENVRKEKSIKFI